MKGEVNKLVVDYKDAIQASFTYCEPYWQQYIRLYSLWRGSRPAVLNGTISKIMLNLWHAAVQDRMPDYFENLYSTSDFVTLSANTPEAEPFVRANEMWLRDLIVDKIRLQQSSIPTLQSALIGGTGYRIPYVTYTKREDKWVPIINSRHADMTSILPSPYGGLVNPNDRFQASAVDWVFFIDYWPDEKVKAMAEKGVFDKEQTRKMLDKTATDREAWPEYQYHNKFQTVNGVSYGANPQYGKTGGVERRRIVHWYRRDKHVIIGEDCYLLYDGEPALPNGAIPLVKYSPVPDMDNWFGISYLQLVEDLLSAELMNFNLRMDHLVGVMFPATWIRDDVGLNKPDSQFIPRPYQVHRFPANADIRQAVYHDRRPDVSPDTFMNEDRMKSFAQKILGQAETTSSLKDVVGNRTATGVTSILSELAGRPTMESTILEQTGLREELQLLLTLGSQHINDKQFIKAPGSKDKFAWTMIDGRDLTDEYSVQVHGTRHLAEKSQDFQKFLAMYPYWQKSQNFDQLELDRHALKIADVFPDNDRLMVSQAPMQAGGGMMEGLMQPGGLSSGQDMNQRTRSTANRSTVEPGTGRAVPAGFSA